MGNVHYFNSVTGNYTARMPYEKGHRHSQATRSLVAQTKTYNLPELRAGAQAIRELNHNPWGRAIHQLISPLPWRRDRWQTVLAKPGERPATAGPAMLADLCGEKNYEAPSIWPARPWPAAAQSQYPRLCLSQRIIRRIPVFPSVSAAGFCFAISSKIVCRTTPIDRTLFRQKLARQRANVNARLPGQIYSLHVNAIGAEITRNLQKVSTVAQLNGVAILLTDKGERCQSLEISEKLRQSNRKSLRKSSAFARLISAWADSAVLIVPSCRFQLPSRCRTQTGCLGGCASFCHSCAGFILLIPAVFPRNHGAFANGAPTILTDHARGPNDPMARNEIRQGILADGRPDRSRGGGLPQSGRKVSVGGQMPGWNVQQCPPHPNLKGCALHEGTQGRASAIAIWPREYSFRHRLRGGVITHNGVGHYAPSASRSLARCRSTKERWQMHRTLCAIARPKRSRRKTSWMSSPARAFDLAG